VKPLLILLLAAGAAGCVAPQRPYRCAQRGELEVCEYRVCRELVNGKFVRCP
jgi:hypothetical protein